MEATKPAASAPITVGASRLTACGALAFLWLWCGCKAEVAQQPDGPIHDLSVDGGEMRNQLDELGKALGAFATDLGPQLDDVTLIK